jgi:hypothetical protein
MSNGAIHLNLRRFSSGPDKPDYLKRDLKNGQYGTVSEFG